MAYTPINVDAYTNAYSGALAGMAISGWIIDPTAADYSEVATIAGAFAQAFDVVWNSATQLNWLQIQSIQSVCQNQFTGHSPGSLDNASFTLAASWAVPAAACAALVLQGDAFVTSEGITPNTPNNNNILNTIWFVNKNTTIPLARQNGSIGAPFSTANAAFVAAQADATANAGRSQVIVFTAADYSAEAAPANPDYQLTLTCWRPFMPPGGSSAEPQPIALAVLNRLTTTSDLVLEGILFIGGPVVARNLGLRGAFCAQSVTAETIKAYEGSQTGDATTTVGDSVWDGCVLPANITQAVGTTCRIRNCAQTAGCAVAGNLQIDSYSNSFQTITATGVVSVAERQAQETIAIVVPAVAAGAVGYVSTVFVGQLTGIPQFAPIVGNPQADLVAAGAGGGFVNCWVDVAGSVRCSFLGPLAGGAVNFTFARL